MALAKNVHKLLEIFQEFGFLCEVRMREDRKHERKSLRVRGWITGCGSELIQCVIEDMSESGAKLYLAHGQPPDQFNLYFSPNASNFRSCTVRWRRKDSVGVQFAGTVAGPAVDKVLL